MVRVVVSIMEDAVKKISAEEARGLVGQSRRGGKRSAETVELFKQIQAKQGPFVEEFDDGKKARSYATTISAIRRKLGLQAVIAIACKGNQVVIALRSDLGDAQPEPVKKPAAKAAVPKPAAKPAK